MTPLITKLSGWSLRADSCLPSKYRTCAAIAGHTARDQKEHGPPRAGLQQSCYSKALAEGCPSVGLKLLCPAVAFPCPTKAHPPPSAYFTATKERPTVSDTAVCIEVFIDQMEALLVTAWLAGAGACGPGGGFCWTSVLGASVPQRLSWIPPLSTGSAPQS